MDLIAKDFQDDLDKISKQIDFIELLRKFSSCSSEIADKNNDSVFLKEANVVHEFTKQIHGNLSLASGTLILYVCGRFEVMTRTLFEDLCQRLVAEAGQFMKLPKKMRENLPIFTAKVISDPRKYGHAEQGVKAFVVNLATNLTSESPMERVNHECLSITEANMRPDMLNDLFGRVGVSSIWTQISQQAAIKVHFAESDLSRVESGAKRKLNELMDLRNRIAHPSGEIEWPSIETLRDYIEFLNVLSGALSDLVAVFEVTLCKDGPPIAADKPPDVSSTKSAPKPVVASTAPTVTFITDRQ